MNEMTNPRAVPGDNVPPIYDEEARAALETRARDLADAAAAWKEAGEIDSEEQAEKANDFLAQARKLFKDVEDKRKSEKEPHLEAGRQIDAAFKSLTTVIEKAAGMVKPLVGDFLKRKEAEEAARRAEAARKAQEEAEAAEAARKAAEARNDVVGEAEAEAAAEAAQKAAAEASKAESAKVGSATGGGRTASLRTYKRVVIENDLALIRHYRKHPKMVELLMTLAQADVRGGATEIPGCTIIEEKRL